jgi:hypothetical protein
MFNLNVIGLTNIDLHDSFFSPTYLSIPLINKEHRMCTKCSENLIGVEFDYLFICSHPEIVNLRVRYQYTELLFEKQQCRKNGWYVVSLSY